MRSRNFFRTTRYVIQRALEFIQTGILIIWKSPPLRLAPLIRATLVRMANPFHIDSGVRLSLLRARNRLALSGKHWALRRLYEMLRGNAIERAG